MTKTFLSVIILFGLNLFSSCTKEQENLMEPKPYFASVSKVEGSTSIGINKDLELTLSVIVNDGCSGFHKYSETIIGDTTEVKTYAISRVLRDRVCTQALKTSFFNYKFVKSKPGNFILKFIKPDNSFIIHKITVQ